MRLLLFAILGGVLLAPALWGLLAAPPAPTPPPAPVPGAPTPEPAAEPGPGGECATGCAAAPADTEALAPAEFRRLLAAFAAEPMSEESPALETLLFHGAESARLLAEEGPGLLDSRRLAFLERELGRTHVRLAVRVVDERGVERMRLGPRRLPWGEKQHLHPDRTTDLQPPELSGTVRRVGLHHLWTRF